MNNQRRCKIRETITKINYAVDSLKEIQSEEEFAYDSMPENLQSSIRGEESEEALSIIEDVICDIEEAVNRLYDINGV